MGAIAELRQETLRVEPGTPVTTRMRVRNTGSVVDEFSFEGLGDASRWITVEPPTVRLFPDADQEVTVTVSPPRSPDVRSGEVPFGVRVASREDPEGSIVVEGMLDVAPFSDVFAELLPRTSKGRRAGKHELAVDNRGNQRVNADVMAYDEADEIDFEVADPGLVVDPGAATFTEVKVKPRDRFWRGPNETKMFKVEVRPEGQAALAVDGTMVQEPLVPAWLPKAMLAALLLALAAVILWMTLLRPSIESAAREAVEEPLQELAAENAAQQEEIDAAKNTAAAANDKANQALGEPAASPSPTLIEETGPELVTESFDFRLRAIDSPGGGDSGRDQTFADNETFALTDIVLANPGGHAGRIRVQRGNSTLLEEALENFRSLDFHFVSPVQFRPGETLRLEITCETPTEGSGSCDAAGYFTGELTTEVEPEDDGTA